VYERPAKPVSKGIKAAAVHPCGRVASKLRRGPLRLSWVVLSGLAACSPYDFSQEVGAFSIGVDQLSNGFTSGYAALAADRAAKTELDLTGARAKVALASSCLVPAPSSSKDQVPCALFRLGDTPPALSGIEQERDRTTALLAVLKDYAHALVAVTNAADRTAYNAAVAQLAATVGSLANEAGPQGAAASTVAPAAVNIIGWVVGTALDQQRFESLKAGVTAASTPLANGEIPINFVVTAAGDGLLALSKARQRVLIAEMNILTGRLGPSLTDAAYRQGLSDAQAVLAVLDGLHHADPTAAAKGLVKAHEALVAAVDDPGRNYASLLKAVGDFRDQAAALQSALSATPAAKNTTTK
jgi:hypothetical protein